MDKLINIAYIAKLASRKDAKGQLIPFHIKFIKQSTGEVVKGNCICTSYFFKNKTMNIKFDSNQFRKIRTITIIEFNGSEAFI